MPEIHENLRTLLPVMCTSKRMESFTSSTWRIVIGGRDFRFNCSGSITRARMWAYDESLRWNIQMRILWKPAVGADMFRNIDDLHIVLAEGNPDEIRDDLFTLRMAL